MINSPLFSRKALFGALTGLGFALFAVGSAHAAVKTHDGTSSSTPLHRAAYSLTGDPLVWLEQKAVANDGAANAEFGTAVDVDGTTAVVGAQDAAIGQNAEQGAVYVYTESDGVWTQSAKLVAKDGAAGNEFGFSVAISGNTIFVGAPYAGTSGGYPTDQGFGYVFTNEGGSWQQTGELTAKDAELNDNLGWSIAADGDKVVVGAGNKHGAQGAAYVFSMVDGNWTQTAELAASDGAPGDLFGLAVAMSGDTILVGADGVPGNGQYLGAAYVFVKTGNGWEQKAILTPSDSAPGDFFGTAVALGGNGSVALVGAYYKKLDKGYRQGAAYIFSNASGSWSQAQELNLGADSQPGDDFGQAVALNEDATLAFIGAPYIDAGDVAHEGAAFVYENSGGAWSQTQELSASDGTGDDNFGIRVAASGTTVVAGAPQFSSHGNGVAYFYGQFNLALAVSAPAHVSPGGEFTSQVLVTNSSSAASPAVSVTVAVPASASFVSANATQGECGETSGVVSCGFGPIAGNAGMATANITLKATGSDGDTIENTASVVKATPPLAASAATAIATNNPPVASDGSLATDENTAASGTLVATDADGDPLTFIIVSQPGHGSVTLDDDSTGAYTYTPAQGYSGDDSFTFKANDGEDDSNTAMVSATVKAASSGGGGGGGALGWLALAALLGLALTGAWAKGRRG